MKNVHNLNQRNWQYHAVWYQRSEDKVYQKLAPIAFPDLECIRIRTLHLKIDQYLFAPKLTNLEALGVRVNLYSMVAENTKKLVVKLLLEAPTNDRKSRYRPENTQKYAAILLQDNEKRDFASEAGEFGILWVAKYMPK